MESDLRRKQQMNQHHCYFHPLVETGVSCNKCGEYICPRDMIQTPVGIRCKQCARVRKIPTFEVSPVYYIRAIVAGLGIGIAGGIVWGYLILFFGGFFLLPWIISLGLGFILGESVSQVTNRKRGPGLIAVVTTGMTLAVAISGLVIGFGFFLGNPFGLLILIGAFYLAISRVR